VQRAASRTFQTFKNWWKMSVERKQMPMNKLGDMAAIYSAPYADDSVSLQAAA
jgi:hypothetical protein